MKIIKVLSLALPLPLMPTAALASMTPISGSFSNTEKVLEKHSGLKEHLHSKTAQRINLLVTVNDEGQQFFIQCFRGGKAGFGVITNFKDRKISREEINAGPECPASKLRVLLDYEEAIISFGNDSLILMRGAIDVPIED
ncbi:hypothetical protein [Agaribacterium sp. ZY112]|uniref:hypothetical protein n=1 Tax=Agaribacterium sp. ZY112 TaxID=3233574 RepID=UPI003526B138